VKPADLLARFGWPALGASALVGIVVAGGLLYTSGGTGARDLLVTEMLINAIIVVGLQVFIGNTGILSLGHLGLAGVAGYTAAILSIPVANKAAFIPNAPFGLADVHVSALVASLIGIALALVIGAFLSLAIARVPDLAATMITLALLFVFYAVALNWQDLTNGAGGMFGIPRLRTRTWVYVGLVICVLGARIFRETRVGRWAQAGREDPIAAESMGINRAWAKTLALLFSVGLVSFGVVLRTQVFGSITPSQFFFDFTLLTVIMLIVGGMSSVTGAIVGVGVITAGSEFTRFLGDGPHFVGFDWPALPGLTGLFLGGAILAVMLLRPAGIVGDWELDHSFARRWRIWRRGGGESPTSAAPAMRALYLSEERPGTTVSRDVRDSTHRSPMPIELVVDGVSVDFGGILALDKVSLEVTNDEVVGLIGPNGAGKTTLLNVITGIVDPSTGRFAIGDRELTGAAPYEIARVGVARTFQSLRLFGALSVRENVSIAALVANRFRPHHRQLDVDVLLGFSGLLDHADRRAGELDYGAQRMLEVARAAALAPDFLLLDEPTSGMGEVESAAMVDHLREVARTIGAGLLVIDHDLHFITTICDRIYVLDNGESIAEGSPEQIRHDPAVIEAYLGAGATGQHIPDRLQRSEQLDEGPRDDADVRGSDRFPRAPGPGPRARTDAHE
jgi:branched-chain amino acid transport system permease protein